MNPSLHRIRERIIYHAVPCDASCANEMRGNYLDTVVTAFGCASVAGMFSTVIDDLQMLRGERRVQARFYQRNPRRRRGVTHGWGRLVGHGQSSLRYLASHRLCPTTNNRVNPVQPNNLKLTQTLSETCRTNTTNRLSTPSKAKKTAQAKFT